MPGSLGSLLSDCCRAATAFCNIAEQGETGADAAVMWADDDKFAFMGIEVSHGYAYFSSLHEAGLKYRVFSTSDSYCDRGRVIRACLAAEFYVDCEAAYAVGRERVPSDMAEIGRAHV